MICAIFLSICSILQTSTYLNRTLGLQLQIPVNASVVTSDTSPPTCFISSRNSSNIWHLRLDRHQNTDDLSPKDLVHLLRGRTEDPQGTKVLTDAPMQVGQLEGWWLLLSQPNGEEQTVIGWLAIPAPGKQYILARIFTNTESWKVEGEKLLRSLSSIVPLDPIAIITEKMEGIKAATNLLSTLNEAKLRPLLGFQEWRRIQTQPNASSLPTDIGYAFVSIEEGYPHEISHDGEEPNSTPKGLLVNLRSRILQNPETRVVIDTTAQYWMSWDGKESRWWNRVTRWLDRAKVTESETGIRSRPTIGSPKSTLLVLQEDLMATTIKPPFKATVHDPWLPRALVWILGPLLTSSDVAPHYEWYMFDNAGKNRIVMRSDNVTKGADGKMTILTRFGEGGDTMSTIVDYSGHLIKQKQAGGVIVTGCTEQLLQSIWEQQGLW